MVVGGMFWHTDEGENFLSRRARESEGFRLWLRADDGDVADGLVDAMRDLSDDGFIVLVTPKVGRPGTIDPADLSDGTDTAGMVLTTSYDVSKDWQAHKIVRPRGGRR